MTLADKILIPLLGGAVITSFFAVRTLTSEGTTVLIQVEGKTVHRAHLLEPGETVVEGVRGEVRVETRDGKVAITHAECPNHICVRTGWRSRGGEVIVCVPNKTVVRIVGETRGSVRAVTG